MEHAVVPQVHEGGWGCLPHLHTNGVGSPQGQGGASSKQSCPRHPLPTGLALVWDGTIVGEIGEKTFHFCDTTAMLPVSNGWSSKLHTYQVDCWTISTSTYPLVDAVNY